MSSGLVSLPGANGTSTTLTVTRPGGHSTNVTVTIAAPPSLDHLDYTLSSSTATVGGSAPTGTVTKWQDAGETTPFTGSVSLSYSSSNTAVATINSSSGVITLVAAGSCTFTVTDSISTKAATTGTLTVSAAGSYAWAATAPLGTAVVSDWPGNDYASSAAFQANANSKYLSNPGTNCTLDTGVQVGGKPTLKIDRSSTDGNLALIIPGGSSLTDTIYHLRRRTESAVANDTFPALTYANWQTTSNGSMCLLMGLTFNPASYGYATTDYYANGVPIGMIGLMLDYNGTPYSGMPVYRLFASVANTSLTVLSDSTSQRGVVASLTGDELFANADADKWLRTSLGTQAVTGYPCLNVEFWMGAPGSAPKRLASLQLIMNDHSTPPMPTHARSFLKEPAMSPTPKVSRLIFHQVFDNATHPNAAFDTSAPGTVTHYQGGLGSRGTGIGTRTVDLSLYTDNTDFQNKLDDAFTGSAGSASRIQAYSKANLALVNTAGSDTAHRNLPYVVNTQTAGVALSVGRLFSNFQNRSQHFWSKESWLFSSGWTGFGAGIKCATFTSAVTASGSPQTVGYADAGGGIRTGHGTAGYGTAGYEGINITAVDTVNHTVTAIFSQNHAIGDEIAYGVGPDYKILQANLRVNGVSEVARLEIVFGSYENYFSTVVPDTAYPALSDLGATGVSVQGTGIFRSVSPTTGTIADCFSIPAINDNGYAAKPGPLAGQLTEVQMKGFYGAWYDSDYGRWRIRVLHTIQAPASAPVLAFFAEATTIYTASDDIYFESIHYGENYNDRPTADQTRHQWDQEEIEGDLLSDPYGVLSAAGMTLPGVATLGSPTPATTTLTYPVTAPASGATVLHVIPEVFNGTVWVPTTATPPAWTAGMGGTQNVVVTGLTSGTNYSNKIRFRMVSSLGMGTPVVATTGTTN